ncbi:MAG: glutamate-5-semialdehyde dehydrogenase [Eubacteriales bacterium]|nr:glutamate-5-semialdehyde dehydrogenase [Eubacteriales bacterium]
MNIELKEKGYNAKQASYILASLSTQKKNEVLHKIADMLVENASVIIAENKIDVDNARSKGTSEVMLNRLALTEDTISGIAEGIKQVATLDDPVGEVINMTKRPNGLLIGKTRVPIGVIGIIFEARPNVTADAAALCLKSGNAVILRGGSEAINSNKILVSVMQKALVECGVPIGCIQLVEDTSRQTATELMQLKEYLDLLIPRGGAGLIRAVTENATVPVIETGVGNCHIYINESADIEMATNILINAKTSRPSVCNAAEKLLIDRSIAEDFLPVLANALQEKGVTLRCDSEALEIIKSGELATDEEWDREYLDYIIGVKVVSDVDEAINHINTHSTKHSEAIITNNHHNAMKFHREIDSAAVYVNASTRFTDGFEFGFGAEIGISTQKMHARGPMGLSELTTVKYIIFGDGQIR